MSSMGQKMQPTGNQSPLWQQLANRNVSYPQSIRPQGMFGHMMGGMMGNQSPYGNHSMMNHPMGMGGGYQAPQGGGMQGGMQGSGQAPIDNGMQGGGDRSGMNASPAMMQQLFGNMGMNQRY